MSEIEKRSIEIEQERMAIDRWKTEQEIEMRKHDLALKEKEQIRSLWRDPFIFAIIDAAPRGRFLSHHGRATQ